MNYTELKILDTKNNKYYILEGVFFDHTRNCINYKFKELTQETYYSSWTIPVSIDKTFENVCQELYLKIVR